MSVTSAMVPRRADVPIPFVLPVAISFPALLSVAAVRRPGMTMPGQGGATHRGGPSFSVGVRCRSIPSGREDRRQFSTVPDADLAQDVRNVTLHGLARQEESLRDLGVRMAASHQIGDLELPGGELIDTTTCRAAPPGPDPECAQLPLSKPFQDQSALVGGGACRLAEGLRSSSTVE